jgi:hypothetical protein
VHPPPSPARANFTLMTECTPESCGCNSVYSVVATFWRTRLGDARPPPFTIFTITYKVMVYTAGTHSPYFYSTPVCSLWYISPACESEGCTPTPFHYIYHHVQSCVYALADRAGTPISTLPLYVFCALSLLLGMILSCSS